MPGIVESTLGIRSLQIRFDRARWSGEILAARLASMLEEADPVDGMAPGSRIVRLPLSWDDPACREAVERYMRVVREDAPLVPGQRRVHSGASTGLRVRTPSRTSCSMRAISSWVWATYTWAPR